MRRVIDTIWDGSHWERTAQRDRFRQAPAFRPLYHTWGSRSTCL